MLDVNEADIVWDSLCKFALNKNESKIVRVNSLQALFDISRKSPQYEKQFSELVLALSKESVPSINARIRKLLN